MLSLFSKQDPDQDLVAAAQRGDVRAFDLLVSRHQARVVQFARGRLDSSIDAEDVAQEIFVAAWRQLPLFRGRSQFKTWLFGIALNWCAEASRRHRRQPASLEATNQDEAGMASAWGKEMPDVFTDITERETIRTQLASLPEPEREVLDLYYYGDLNLREISELLQVNLSTLKTRFYQAHRRLRANFETEAVGAGSTGRGRRA